MSIPRLIGMVHLAGLPGSPAFGGDLDRVIESAVADALILQDAGFDALMIENFGDAPFYSDDVPKLTVASMTRSVASITDAVSIPVGVNVLRNDGLAAAAVAAVTGAPFIRVNVLSGTMHTDQGTITGKAAELSRFLARHAPSIEILADIFVKHASPPAGLTIEQAAADAWERSGASALVISGSGTGDPTNLSDLSKVRSVVPDAHLVVGSGASPDTAAELLKTANSIIAGTSLKIDGVTTGPVDRQRAEQFVAAAH